LVAEIGIYNDFLSLQMLCVEHEYFKGEIHKTRLKVLSQTSQVLVHQNIHNQSKEVLELRSEAQYLASNQISYQV